LIATTLPKQVARTAAFAVRVSCPVGEGVVVAKAGWRRFCAFKTLRCLQRYNRHMDALKRPRRNICLSLTALLLPPLVLPAFAANATGHFEVYCDAVGIFLAKIDGAPAPGKLVLFSYLGFPPGTMGGNYLGQGRWSDVSAFPNECFPKCESVAHGKIWIDAWEIPDAGHGPPKGISGRYEIDFKSKRVVGRFVAKQRHRKHLLRVCM
jgi:hypothetical protein